MIHDRIDRDRRLAGLTVADDQLALPTANRNHCIDGLDTCRQRHLHRLTRYHARRHPFDRAPLGKGDRALPIDRVAKRIDHAAQQALAYRHRDNATGTPDLLAFLNCLIGAQDDHADGVLFEVGGHAHHPVGELHQLAVHHPLQAIDVGNAVTYFDHGADAYCFGLLFEMLDLIFDYRGNLVRSYCHSRVPPRFTLLAADGKLRRVCLRQLRACD